MANDFECLGYIATSPEVFLTRDEETRSMNFNHFADKVLMTSENYEMLKKFMQQFNQSSIFYMNLMEVRLLLLHYIFDLFYEHFAIGDSFLINLSEENGKY